MESNAILLIYCKDTSGIIAAVTNFITKYDGNVVELDEHVDVDDQIFFMRIKWSMATFKLDKDAVAETFEKEVGTNYILNYSLHYSDKKPRLALFVSKYAHCLYDILGRYQSKEWAIEIPLIISNHPDMEPLAKAFDIPYHYIPLDKNNKDKQEPLQLELLKAYAIDVVILARYMQILSPAFIQAYPNKIINIHHSFLPAFAGAKPYHSAHKRGVKIIGASSHYVNEALDEGPLIEQDVARVSHKDTIQDMMRKGRDLEKIVLSRAIWQHINRKVLVYGNKTIVFE